MAMDVAGRTSAMMERMHARGAGIVVFLVIVLMLLVLIIAYIVYRVVGRDRKSKLLVSQPHNLASAGPLVVKAAEMPTASNGREYSYTMWLHLTDFVTTVDPKPLMLQTTTDLSGGVPASGALQGTSPILFLDAGTNRMYVAVATNQTPTTTAFKLKDVLQAGTSKYLVATVDYVPLQRWVHFGVVVQDNLLYVYQDGDLYTVQNVFDMGLQPRPVLRAAAGGVVVGTSPGMGAGAQGVVMNLRFFNHALSLDQVRGLYNRGPSRLGLNKLALPGIPDYGVRWPVYKIDAASGAS